MPLQSMTGFARAAGAFEQLSWVWETKSVNGRGLDVRMRLPSGFEGLEQGIRAAIGRRFKRGTIQLSLNYAREQSSADIRLNETALDAVVSALKTLRSEGFEDPDPAVILGLKGVLETASNSDDEETLAARDKALTDSAEEALDALAVSRGEEGIALNSVLTGQLQRISELAKAAEETAAAQPEKVRERIKTQVAALLEEGAQVQEDRLAQELAIIAVKADVREEIDRLAMHVSSGLELLTASEPVGRKLDFLTQELNREANTICSKAGDIALTQIGLELKTVIDQVREQVQNVE